MEFHFNEVFEHMMKLHNLDTVILLGHINPDGDASGSVMGLSHYIDTVYPEYRAIPFLAGNLDQGPGKFVRSDQIFAPFSAPKEKNYGVIVCDTATKARIYGYEIYEKAEGSIVIDHHRSNEGYGEVNNTCRSEACCENIFHMLDWKRWLDAGKTSRSGDGIHPNAADYIYMGILHDTECFSRAKLRTFEAAAGLLKLGVDHNYAMGTMHTRTFEELKKVSQLYQMAKCTDDGKTAYVVIDRHTADEKAISYEDIQPVSGCLRDCEDLEIGFTMFEEEPGAWRCSFRSDGKRINVNDLLRPFGGGGHAGSAGLRIRTDNIEKLKQQILELMAEMKDGRFISCT